MVTPKLQDIYLLLATPQPHDGRQGCKRGHACWLLCAVWIWPLIQEQGQAGSVECSLPRGAIVLVILATRLNRAWWRLLKWSVSICKTTEMQDQPHPGETEKEAHARSAHPLQGGAARNLGRKDLVPYGFLRLDHFLGLAHNLCKHSWSGSVLNHGVWESSSPFVPDLWGRAQGGCVCKCDSLLTCVRVRVHECVLGHVSMRLCIWV